MKVNSSHTMLVNRMSHELYLARLLLADVQDPYTSHELVFEDDAVSHASQDEACRTRTYGSETSHELVFEDDVVSHVRESIFAGTSCDGVAGRLLETKFKKNTYIRFAPRNPTSPSEGSWMT